MRKVIFIILAALFFDCSVFAQSRIERPIQVQLNFSGAFLKVFGNSLAGSEVDHLEVKDWVLPGISAGYHFRKLLYGGYSYTPSRGLTLEGAWGFSNEKDGYINLDYATGHLHNLELRISPFENGFYGQFYFNHIPKVSYNMDYQRNSETVLIGENEYATDLLVNWDFKTVNAFGIGFGYNWIFRKGISLNLGVAFPVIKSPFYENIEITPKDPAVVISERDLEFARLSISNETFYYPVQFIINVGYNFRKTKEEITPPDRF